MRNPPPAQRESTRFYASMDPGFFAAAEKLALPEPQIWMQLSQLYTKADDKEGATRTMLKNQEYALRQQQLMAKEQAAKSGGIKLPGAAEPQKK